MEWNETLSVGITSIDAQHKKLVDAINAFYDGITNNSKKVEILDMTGRIVFANELNNASLGQNSILINTQLFSNGIYFINIYNNKDVIKGEFIINR